MGSIARVWTEDEDRALRDLRGQGMDWAQVAEAMGLSFGAIKARAARLKLVETRPSRPRDPKPLPGVPPPPREPTRGDYGGHPLRPFHPITMEALRVAERRWGSKTKRVLSPSGVTQAHEDSGRYVEVGRQSQSL